MEIRTLKYFLEIAQMENMTKASANLHVSQSALSRQMSDLEAELNTTLFIRTNKSTRLTEDGLHLKSRAEEIIRGDVFIGAGETVAMKLIAEGIKRTNEKHPEVAFHLYTGTADDISTKLEKCLLDFGLLINPRDTSQFSCIDMPVTDTGGIYVRQDSLLAPKDSVSLYDLQNVPLLCPSRQVELLQLAWHNIHLPPETLRCRATFNLFYNASLLVKAGLGCAVSIGGLYENSSLRFIPFKPALQTPLVFVWKKFRDLPKPCEVFLEEFGSVLQSSDFLI